MERVNSGRVNSCRMVRNCNVSFKYDWLLPCYWHLASAHAGLLYMFCQYEHSHIDTVGHYFLHHGQKINKSARHRIGIGHLDLKWKSSLKTLLIISFYCKFSDRLWLSVLPGWRLSFRRQHPRSERSPSESPLLPGCPKHMKNLFSKADITQQLSYISG